MKAIATKPLQPFVFDSYQSRLSVNDFKLIYFRYSFLDIFLFRLVRSHNYGNRARFLPSILYIRGDAYIICAENSRYLGKHPWPVQRR